MLKLSKKTEYAFMAVKYIALNQNGCCITAKEISDKYDISYELLSKVLQRLNKHQIVSSFQGAKGGYVLNKSPFELTLIDIIRAIEDDYKITDCMNGKGTTDDCRHVECCTIRDPLLKVQKEIERVFSQTTLNQIL
ncbi:MAG: Rrf2 family transcriptional regulator [Ignavibacteriales bacterium]|nr:MAG: Rrf2 family transcriptional regulator [Ignavibacteriales bacterium]